MTTKNTNERMLQPYIEGTKPAGYLTSSFRVESDGMHNNEKISIDVQSDDDDVAWPVGDHGWHMNRRNGFANKEWTPPVYKEGFAVGASDLMTGRAIGENPFVTPVLGTRAQAELNRMALKLQHKIQNALEIQASQILTTGALSLTDDTGAVRYAETFGALATHFPVAGTDWGTSASAVPLTEISSLCDVVVADGGEVPNRIRMNSITYKKMIACASFITAMDNTKRMWFGQMDSQPIGTDTRGGVKMGTIFAAPYVLEVWCYDKTYKHPQTGVRTKYIPDDRYIVDAGGRMIATFGGLANFGTDGRGSRYFMRVSNPSAMTDLSVVTWVTEDGTAINIGVGGRPLLIPVAVNTFGCGKATVS